jgi:hypothetical protein
MKNAAPSVDAMILQFVPQTGEESEVETIAASDAMGTEDAEFVDVIAKVGWVVIDVMKDEVVGTVKVVFAGVSVGTAIVIDDDVAILDALEVL